MAAALAHYCWSCYGENDTASGPCVRCGDPIDPPAGTSFPDRLIWALGHPVAERRAIAVQVLANRRERSAARRLRELASHDSDPFLAAAALEALVQLEGVAPLRGWLETLSESGTAQLRATARKALRE